MEFSTKPAESLPNPQELPKPASSAAAPAPSQAADQEALREKIVETLRSIYDPEIPVNIYEIGLIYTVDIDPSNAVNIRMTLTSPACPAAGTLPGEVEDKTSRVQGVTDVKVELVWDPTWSPAMMSETAKLQLGML
ncbi:MAG: SUF system Fe-S cluster assembly protein [Acidobacteria bacterium]|nr:SUF system Fe-S cluster assembly protein [Acidobacteriota bacterium]MCI0624512.1 SUF system Fe-S cluster assembly protein [Acidobacteriota bacterium]MCI0720914.1 SUF system Fe-S cluster assembly protein [Acidobacteriota bacterium]